MESKLAFALREQFRDGYSFSDLKADVMAGLVVGMVAIPLGMALAIASGVAPQYGLYTVIVAGAIAALLGGSRFNVTGPTAAFVVVLLPVVQEFGIAGLLTAGGMAGILLILLGVAGLGQIIKLIPYPVTTGFTSGIAVVIATLQIKDFFGLKTREHSESFTDRMITMFEALPTLSLIEASVAIFTLFILVAWPRINHRIPSPLVALTAAALLTALIHRMFPSIEISTIGNRFSSLVDGKTVSGIPQVLPSFDWPWNLPGPDGKPFSLDFKMIKGLFPSAIAIALLGAIESLLCAVVADGMTQTKHDPDSELIGLGTANVICPFLGGIAATGAIARTATSIRFGAKSPVAGIVHALFALVVLLLFAPYVSYLPMAALAALLVLVAYNMSEIKHFTHILKVAPRSDVTVLLTCFSLTVFFDMIVGVGMGILLAALLFMRRMVALTSGKILTEGAYHKQNSLPKEILLYEIAGPLFFGAAEKAISKIGTINDGIRVVIFDLEDVPIMDVTGLVAFEAAIHRLFKSGKTVILAGVKEQPSGLISTSEIIRKHPKRILFVKSVDEAMKHAKSAIADATSSS